MKSITVITHVDADGYAAAAIVKKKYPNDDIDIILTNYRDDIANKTNRILNRDMLFILDASIPAWLMEKYAKSGLEITWIDHHKANDDAIERELESRGVLSKIKGIRNNTKSGTYLTWEYLFPNEPVPYIVTLVNDWDLWIKAIPNAAIFQNGIHMFEGRPNMKQGMRLWLDLLNDTENGKTIQRVLTIGKMITEYQNKFNLVHGEDLIYESSIDYNVDGQIKTKQVLAMNTKQGNSLLFDYNTNQSAFDGVVLYQWDPKQLKYRYSIYAPKDTKKDIVEVALAYGGGGHPGAAGFTADNNVIKPQNKKSPRLLIDAIRPYKELMTMEMENPVIAQYAGKGISIVVKGFTFLTKFGPNIPAIAINHPYLPTIVGALRYVADITSIDSYAKVAVGYVMVKEGYYRVCVIPLDRSVTLDIFKQAFPKGEIIDDAFWYYSDTVPVPICN